MKIERFLGGLREEIKEKLEPIQNLTIREHVVVLWCIEVMLEARETHLTDPLSLCQIQTILCLTLRLPSIQLLKP